VFSTSALGRVPVVPLALVVPCVLAVQWGPWALVLPAALEVLAVAEVLVVLEVLVVPEVLAVAHVLALLVARVVPHWGQCSDREALEMAPVVVDPRSAAQLLPTC
jgi:hypothetical protein